MFPRHCLICTYTSKKINGTSIGQKGPLEQPKPKSEQPVPFPHFISSPVTLPRSPSSSRPARTERRHPRPRRHRLLSRRPTSPPLTSSAAASARFSLLPRQHPTSLPRHACCLGRSARQPPQLTLLSPLTSWLCLSTAYPLGEAVPCRPAHKRT